MNSEGIKASHARMSELYEAVIKTVMTDDKGCNVVEISVVLTRVLGELIAAIPPGSRGEVIRSSVRSLEGRMHDATKN